MRRNDLENGEVSKIRQEDHELLEPGMRVRIMSRLMGSELYGGDDPEELQEWCGQEVTVARVHKHSEWMVYIEEDEDACFYMEEIECIVEDTEIAESEESIDIILGGVM